MVALSCDSAAVASRIVVLVSAPRDEEQASTEDELWDPDAQRRDLLAMTMEERLEIVAALFAQSHLFAQRGPERR